MKLKDATLFLVGIMVIILGSFIVVFDYPQIQYFEKMESELYLVLDVQDKEVYQRLQIEFTIGAMILVTGTVLLFVGVLRKSKRK